MKRHFSLGVIMLLAVSMLLAACGGGGGGDEGGGKASGKTELNFNISTEPPSLNPGLASDNTSSTVLLQTFEGLTRINQKGEPEEAMAEDIQVSDDQKKYTFKLRDSNWSNGDPVTAEDFVYAWKWALDPKNKSEYAYQLYYIAGAEAANSGKGSLDDVGVKAVDDKTLEVTLENPTPYFLELTAFYTYYPVNSKIAKEHSDWADNAGENYTSNGPFKLTEWEHNSKVVIEKNDEYWDKDSVKLEKINMAMINDANTELSSFDNGELDWAGSPTGTVPPDSMKALKDDGRLNIKPIAAIYNYKFNTTKPPFNNVNIRKAFALAINREEIIKNVTQGEQVPAMAIVPPSMFTENEKGYFKDNDVEQAKQYLQKGLDEMGLKDASELPEITLVYNTDDAHKAIAEAIQDMWNKNLGVDVKLENGEWQVILDKVSALDYQIARMGWVGDFNDPINFLELYRDADGGNNDTGWENPEFQKLLDQSQTEKDAEKRMQLLKDAEKIFIDEMPVAPIYFYTNVWVQNEKLKDVSMSGLGDIQFKWAYFEE